MNWRKSSGKVPAGSEPSATIRSRTSGWLRILMSSACSRVTMGLGRLAGPMMPYQPTTSKPGSASATAGTSGRAATRFGVVMASPRSLPPRISVCAPSSHEKL